MRVQLTEVGLLENPHAVNAESNFENGLARLRAFIPFIRRTFPSMLCNTSRPETKSMQAWASHLLMQALLVLLPDFLAQLQSELRERCEAHIRVKSMKAAQQTMNCCISVLEA
jgi:hypothetical protein